MVDEAPVLREGPPWDGSIDVKAVADVIVSAASVLERLPKAGQMTEFIHVWQLMVGLPNRDEAIALAHQIASTAGPVTAHVAPF